MDSQPSIADLMRHAQELISQKDAMEKELKELDDRLRGYGVGMDVSLIDVEGFPKRDLDIPAIRADRHRVYCLRNDHKNLMLTIENALHDIHQAKRTSTTSSSQPALTPEPPKPFARVNAVAPDSPAQTAGLQREDQLVRFGHVHHHNHDHLQALNELVSRSENKTIQVLVLRKGVDDPVTLSLTPHRGWGGRGLLGCHIMPLE